MTSSGTATEAPFLSAEAFFFLHEAGAATAVLSAADRLGILERLRAGAVDATVLARDCAIGPRGAEVLLGALASLGLVATEGEGTYRPVSSGLDWFAAERARWERLPDALRDNPGPLTADTPAGASALYPPAVRVLAALVPAAAERTADRLAAPGLRVLDVGAGAAPWSRAVAARDRGIRVCALDLPRTLQVTREAVEAAGQSEQFDYLAGDAFATEWGRGAYDLVILGNFCHLFAEDANRELLGRAFAALRAGGRVAIVDILPNERLDGPRSATLYAVGLLLRTSRGRAYPFSTYAGWLRSAGFEHVERAALTDTPPLTLVTARRPELGATGAN